MLMPKTITLCKDYMSEVCDKVTESLNECGKNTLSEDLYSLVEITTRNYKDLLMTIMFGEKGEE